MQKIMFYNKTGAHMVKPEDTEALFRNLIDYEELERELGGYDKILINLEDDPQQSNISSSTIKDGFKEKILGSREEACRDMLFGPFTAVYLLTKKAAENARKPLFQEPDEEKTEDVGYDWKEVYSNMNVARPYR